MNKTIIYCRAVAEEKIKGKWVVTDDNHNNLNREISEEEYHKIASQQTIAFFRGLGGTETFTRNNAGKIKRLISLSPSKKKRVVYTFEFVESEVA